MFRNRNQVDLPLENEKIIPKDDPVFKLAEICDKLDYSRLEKEYVRAWRKLNPATMFILLVYAYMRRLYSSRQIEEACKTDTVKSSMIGDTITQKNMMSLNIAFGTREKYL